jgi:AAA+ superfamily predicted ATPase
MDPVVTALDAALVGAPPDARPALLLALGERLVSIGDTTRALDRLTELLAIDPTHMSGLDLAATAAEAVGQTTRAAGYRRLLTALSPSSPAPVPLRAALSAGPDSADAQDAGDDTNVVRLGLAPPPQDHTGFADVGGLADVKRRIDLSFLAPLRDPGLYAAYGKTIRGGLLLYGPPGCGKTHLARATAGEVGARFTAIGLIDVIDMYIGESEKRLHELFEQARREAPTVIFLDELDALGQKRSQLRHNGGRNLVNQLLVELDGLDSKDGVYVLAATNHPWDVDPALKRPGRFDRTIFVPPPDLPARLQILTRNLERRPTLGLRLDAIAARTDGWSGADLVHLCDSAVELVLEEALAGRPRRPIGMGDLDRALLDQRPSVGPWMETARNYALFANEGGSYDDLAAWLKQKR